MKRTLCGLALLMAALLAGCASRADVRDEAPELLEPVGVKVDTAVVERQKIFT